DLVSGKAMIATRYDGLPILPAHGGPARLLVPHLYFWKSAKWVQRLQFMERNQAGFWESLGYHIYGDPWKEQRYDGDLGGGRAGAAARLAGCHRSRDRRRDAACQELDATRPRPAGTSPGPARRHPAHWRGWISGAAELLDRFAAGR